ncbi:MAG: 16S rRNA (uracil(1498)-N(3))-methyltransferase [Betaproteobacteria bacterium]
MLTPRIFIGANDPLSPGADCVLAHDAARHVAQSLRMRVGERLALFTGEGGEYAATIVRIDRKDVVVRVDRHAGVERELARPVTLVQATIAADLMDLVVRKAVELGVAAIVPVESARSQRIPTERAARRVEHWRVIAIAACEQCGRNRVPDVHAITTFDAWLHSGAPQLTPWALLDGSGPRSLLDEVNAQMPRAVAIGPEGGFTPDEREQALASGAVAAHLGARVLRAETAALAALAIVGTTLGSEQ